MTTNYAYNFTDKGSIALPGSFLIGNGAYRPSLSAAGLVPNQSFLRTDGFFYDPAHAAPSPSMNRISVLQPSISGGSTGNLVQQIIWAVQFKTLPGVDYCFVIDATRPAFAGDQWTLTVGKGRVVADTLIYDDYMQYNPVSTFLGISLPVYFDEMNKCAWVVKDKRAVLFSSYDPTQPIKQQMSRMGTNINWGSFASVTESRDPHLLRDPPALVGRTLQKTFNFVAPDFTPLTSHDGWVEDPEPLAAGGTGVIPFIFENGLTSLVPQGKTDANTKASSFATTEVFPRNKGVEIVASVSRTRGMPVFIEIRSDVSLPANPGNENNGDYAYFQIGRNDFGPSYPFSGGGSGSLLTNATTGFVAQAQAYSENPLDTASYGYIAVEINTAPLQSYLTFRLLAEYSDTFIRLYHADSEAGEWVKIGTLPRKSADVGPNPLHLRAFVFAPYIQSDAVHLQAIRVYSDSLPEDVLTPNVTMMTDTDMTGTETILQHVPVVGSWEMNGASMAWNGTLVGYDQPLTANGFPLYTEYNPTDSNQWAMWPVGASMVGDCSVSFDVVISAIPGYDPAASIYLNLPYLAFLSSPDWNYSEEFYPTISRNSNAEPWRLNLDAGSWSSINTTPPDYRVGVQIDLAAYHGKYTFNVTCVGEVITWTVLVNDVQVFTVAVPRIPYGDRLPGQGMLASAGNLSSTALSSPSDYDRLVLASHITRFEVVATQVDVQPPSPVEQIYATAPGVEIGESQDPAAQPERTGRVNPAKRLYKYRQQTLATPAEGAAALAAITPPPPPPQPASSFSQSIKSVIVQGQGPNSVGQSGVPGYFIKTANLTLDGYRDLQGNYRHAPYYDDPAFKQRYQAQFPGHYVYFELNPDWAMSMQGYWKASVIIGGNW